MSLYTSLVLITGKFQPKPKQDQSQHQTNKNTNTGRVRIFFPNLDCLESFEPSFPSLHFLIFFLPFLSSSLREQGELKKIERENQKLVILQTTSDAKFLSQNEEFSSRRQVVVFMQLAQCCSLFSLVLHLYSI